MHPGEPANKLRFAIGFRAALFKVGKILEEVSKQIRVTGAGLVKGSGDDVHPALREREF